MTAVLRHDFDREVVRTSRHLPVVVEFTAAWSPQSRMLGATLARLEREHAPRLRVVRIELSERPEIAAMLGIRAAPAVVAFRDGQAVAAFAGVLPESKLRGFLAQLLPTPGVDEVIEGRAHLRAGRWRPAADLLRVALAVDPSRDDLRADYVRALIELDRLDEAWRAWLPLRGRTARDPALAAMGLWIEALSAAQDAPGEAGLREAAEAGTPAARYALAQWLMAQRRWAEALDVLIAMVSSDRAFGEDLARRTVLAVFELAQDAALVSDYRRRLAAALF